MSMDFSIKPAVDENELASAFNLIYALACHENSVDDFKITRDIFTANASGPNPHIHVLIALLNGDPVGVATFVKRFHIWNATELIELDDLYVTESARGNGIGNQLLQVIGDQAKQQGIPVKWQVQPDNHGAIALYKRIGARYSESGICFWKP
jgi:GNAT superfamily N-acetyltransferase